MNEPVIHLIEDEPVLAESLAFLLASRGLASAHFSSGEAFLAAIDARRDWHTQPGCIVLDVRMPHMSGIELFDRLRAQWPELPIPVIFLTGHGDIQMAVDALKAGAFDFFEKPFSDNRLVDRIVAAIDDSRQRIARLADAGDVAVRLARLSTREREVMQKVLAGVLNKNIATELGISMRTVEVHRANIFAKMGVRSAVELARLIDASNLAP